MHSGQREEVWVIDTAVDGRTEEAFIGHKRVVPERKYKLPTLFAKFEAGAGFVDS